METNSLPEHLQTIADQVVEHVHSSTSLPDNLDDLIDWFKVDGWDEIVDAWDDEQMVLPLPTLAQMRFSDESLLEYSEVEGELTDRVRIDFARQQINCEFEYGAEYLCPSVHSLELVDLNGRTAVLGWLVAIHGQGGTVPTCWGVYADREEFYRDLRESGFLFSDWKDVITDQQLLALWER